MRFLHPDHPGRAVRLAYCMNVHPAETLEEFERGLTSITLPLRDRLAGAGRFGIGMYFAADLAARLVAEPALLEDLASPEGAAEVGDGSPRKGPPRPAAQPNSELTRRLERDGALLAQLQERAPERLRQPAQAELRQALAPELEQQPGPPALELP